MTHPRQHFDARGRMRAHKPIEQAGKEVNQAKDVPVRDKGKR